MKRIGLLALVTALVVGCGKPEWTNVGIGGGGGIFLPVSSPHDPNLMFCSSDMSGVYRSIDAGRSWRMLPWNELSSSIGCAIAFDPDDPNVLYNVPGSGYLMVSRDKGLTWSRLTEKRPWADEGQRVGRIDVSPSRFLILSTDTGAWMTTGGGEWIGMAGDDGAAFARCEGITTAIHRIVFARSHAPPGQTLMSSIPVWFAGTRDAVLVSTDGGRTWKPTGKVPADNLQDFCGGWEPPKGERAVGIGRVALYIAVDSRVEDGSTASGSPPSGKFAGGIYRSDDLGKTWVSAMGEGINTFIGANRPGQRAVAQYHWLGMPSNQTDTVYAYSYGTGPRPPRISTVFRTDDGGRSWRTTMIGPRGLSGQNVELGWLNYDQGWAADGILSFHVNDRTPDVVAWSSAIEIFVTSNGARTWRQAYTRCADPPPDRGHRWSSVGMEMTTCWRYKFDPHDPNRTYICYTDIGFARSLDRGESWTISTAGCPWDNTFYDLIFDPDKPGVLYAACADRHDIPSWKMADKFGGGGGVCVSTDWGRFWRPMGKGQPRVGACMAVVMDPKTRTFWSCWHGAGVYRSDDGGKTWQAMSNGLDLDVNSHFTDLKRCDDGTLYALCGAKRADRKSLARGGLFKSTDNGESWTELIAPLDLRLPYGFDVLPGDSETIWLCAGTIPQVIDPAGVYKSTDGGKTWTKMKIDWPPGIVGWTSPMFPSIDPQRPDRVWVSSGTNGMVVTTDGGRTWKSVKGLPFKGVTRVTVDPKDRNMIWCASFGGGIWHGPALGTE